MAPARGPWGIGTELDHTAEQVLFIESLVILSFSILSCTGVLILINASRLKPSGQGDPTRRDRETRVFLDFTVSILVGSELIQSLNWLAGTILSDRLRVTAGMSPHSHYRRKLGIACDAIGFMTYANDIQLYIWNACLAYAMWGWVVKNHLLKHLQRQMQSLFLFSLVMAMACTMVPLSQHSFGTRDNITCWLTDVGLMDPPVLLNKIIVLPICWAISGWATLRTFLHLHKERKGVGGTAPIARSYRRLRLRLLAFTSIFFFTWLLNSVWYVLLSYNTVSLWLGIIGKLYYSVGLLHSMTFTWGSWRRRSRSDKGNQRAQGHRSSNIRSSLKTVTQFVGVEPPMDKANIFATTWNCGRCTKVSHMGPLSEWVPISGEGYDIVVVALQECKFFTSLRAAIHKHLGGPECFTLFHSELGDSVVGNGVISVLVFGRVADVQSGSLRLCTAGPGRVNAGVKLGVKRLPNKGVVGLSFMYRSCSIAFVTGHFASDSGGQRRLWRRNRDASRTLRSLHLVGDVESFDLQYQHHHVILLGDLNYRAQAYVDEMLAKIASGALMEQAEYGLCYRDQQYEPLLTLEEFNHPPDEHAHHHKSSAEHVKAMTWQERQQEVEVKEEEQEGGGLIGLELTCIEEGRLGTFSDDQQYWANKEQTAAEDAWSWVEKVDELRMVMNAGLAFFGFQEGRVGFPPSFKYHVGRTIEDYSEVEDLRFAYQTWTEATPGGAGEARPPSWTDRILFHSLPDLNGHLKLLHYTMCEAITGSDHRPVSAAVKLTFFKLDQEDFPSQPPQEMESTASTPTPPHGPSLALQHESPSPSTSTGGPGERASPGGRDHLDDKVTPEEGEEKLLDQLALDLSGSGRWNGRGRGFGAADRDLEGGEKEERDEERDGGEYKVIPKARSFGRGLSSNAGRNRTFSCKITNFSFDISGAADPANLRLVPSTVEVESPPEAPPPPSFTHLKRHDTSNSSIGSRGGAMVNIPAMPSLRRGESSQTYSYSAMRSGDSGVASQRLEDLIDSVVVLMPIPCEDPYMADRRVVLLDLSYYPSDPGGSDSTLNEAGQHVHRLPWSEVQSQGIRVTATVLYGTGLHAVMKLVDKQGMDLGQACLCLGGLFQKSREQRMQHCGSSRVTTRMQLPLSSGGVYKGMVSFDISLRERRLRS